MAQIFLFLFCFFWSAYIWPKNVFLSRSKMEKTVWKCEGLVRCEWRADWRPVNDWQPENPQRLSQGRVEAGFGERAHLHIHMLDQIMEPKKGIFILDWKFTHKPFKDAVHFFLKKVVDYFLFGVFFVGNILNKIYFIKQKQFPSLKEKTTTTHLTKTKWFESYHNVVQISCTKEEINGVYISETNNLLRSSISPPT